MPSHFLDQCWNTFDWTPGNKLQWNFNQNSYIFIQGNTLENIVCKMALIFSHPQCIKWLRWGYKLISRIYILRIYWHVNASTPHWWLINIGSEVVTWTNVDQGPWRHMASLGHNDLIHWGRVTHICIGKLIIIDSDNGLSPWRHQAIIWTNWS